MKSPEHKETEKMSLKEGKLLSENEKEKKKKYKKL